MTQYRWVICAMLFFATTVNYLDRQVLSLTWDEFIKPEFHWNEYHYGLITSIFSIVYAVCMLFAGRFIDWMGTKKGYLWAIGVWSLGACLHALCGVATEAWVGLPNAAALRAVEAGSAVAATIAMVSMYFFIAARCILALGEAGNFPAAIKVTLKGKLQPCVSGKDVILHLIGEIGVDGALYQSLEFAGEGVSSLSMDDRFTISNMAIEAGGKNGIFPVDEKTMEYINGRVGRPCEAFEADPDAVYTREVVIDLDKLEPTVSMPHLPENTKVVSEVAGLHIDQVVIGSCTNGRIQDLREAAAILKGKKVAENVRCIVIPATQEITLQAMKEGLLEIFIASGCAVSAPTCGPCLGGHMGVMAEGERCVSTTNRNFVGRMGHVQSEVILASPAVAAASAVAGCVADPRI